jgi:hypothetical protein
VSNYEYDYRPPIGIAYAGGVSRSGQTSVANYYQKLNPIAEILSTDTDIRGPLWADPYLRARGYVDDAFSIHSLERALNQKFYDQEWLKGSDDETWITNFLGDNPSPYIRRQFDQSRAVARLGHLHEHAIYRARNPLAVGAPLVEGIAALPEDIARVRDTYPEMEVRSVTIVNLNPAHSEVIKERVEHVKEIGNLDDDWMAKAGWSNRKVIAYMGKMLDMSHELVERAEKVGLHWFDMGQGDFEDNVRHVAEYLSRAHGLVRQHKPC